MFEMVYLSSLLYHKTRTKAYVNERQNKREVMIDEDKLIF